MNPRGPLFGGAWCVAALLFAAAPTHPLVAVAPAMARSVSSSQQFIVYCQDATLRGRVTSLVEELRASTLNLLDDHNRWKVPIVLTLRRAELPSGEPVSLRLFETPEGSTIQLDIRIGDKPAEVQFQKQIIRAVLLEYVYRYRPAVRGGEAYVEAPWWLVDGAQQIYAQRETGVQSGLYRGVIESNKVPDIEEFLATADSELGTAAQAVDASYAMCLVQLLTEQPSGRACLARLLQHWPELHETPGAALSQAFPSLGTSPMALQKWWTLNLARLSAVDRYKGLSIEATDKECAEWLKFELAVNKAGEKKTFTLSQFEEFSKLPSSKAAMVNAQAAMVALSIRANALFRPIVADYEQIFASLARGKTRGVAERLARVQRYREAVLHRMDAIADYLNWYEATQFGTRSNAFDGFLKAAREVVRDEAAARRANPVSRYLDELEAEF